MFIIMATNPIIPKMKAVAREMSMTHKSMAANKNMNGAPRTMNPRERHKTLLTGPPSNSTPESSDWSFSAAVNHTAVTSVSRREPISKRNDVAVAAALNRHKKMSSSRSKSASSRPLTISQIESMQNTKQRAVLIASALNLNPTMIRPSPSPHV